MRTVRLKSSLAKCSYLSLFTTLLFATIPAAQAQYFGSTQYIEPAYSSFTAGYAQASFDDYNSNASDMNFRFEQQLLHNMYLSGQYFDFSESQTDFSFAAELEDMQIGLGYMERSELGPHVDASVLVGRETFQRPILDEPNAAMIEKSNYFGLQIGLREVNGPLEVQAALAYLFHDGNRDDQIRWHIGAYLTVWKTLSVGLRYQDFEDYSVRSVEVRLSW